MDHGSTDEPPPSWVSVAALVAMAGGVGVAAAAAFDNPVAGVLGAVTFFGGIAAAAAGVVNHSRRIGAPIRSAAWQGIKTAVALVRDLAP